jgi:hypothetical protein
LNWVTTRFSWDVREELYKEYDIRNKRMKRWVVVQFEKDPYQGIAFRRA